jgi:hypothetical protein
MAARGADLSTLIVRYGGEITGRQREGDWLRWPTFSHCPMALGTSRLSPGFPEKQLQFWTAPGFIERSEYSHPQTVTLVV